MAVPYTFGTATAAIPLSQLDSNFATAITIGNTAVQLGNTVTTLNNMTLANVTISSGTITITNVAVTTANVSGTANISTLVVVGNETVGGNTSVTGNSTVAGSVVLSGGTANGVAYLNGSKVLTTGSALVFDGTNLGVGVTPSAWKSSYRALAVSNADIASATSIGLSSFSANAYLNASDQWIYKITDGASRYQQYAGIHSWYTAASGTAGNAITFTQSLAVEKAKSLALEGATSQTGTGITFPATQSASSDANTLDDYEEGTWTPSQGAGLTVVGAFSSSGSYTKIGRLVSIYGTVFGATSVATTAGTIMFGSLPFSAAGISPVGAMNNDNRNVFGGISVFGTTGYSATTIGAGTRIDFSITYSV